MTEFKDLVQKRRSHRKYTDEEIDADDLKLIIRAALMSPTSKNQRAWQFVVVDDKQDLEKLADAKNLGSQFLKDAPVAIVVLGDPMQNDCWVEDGSIAAAFNSIEKATGRHFELEDFQIQAITEGREAVGETIVKLRHEGKLYSGRGISTDIVGAGILAYMNALNKIVYEEEEA